LFCIPLSVQAIVLSKNQKMNRSEYIKSIAAVAVIVVVVLGFFFGLSFALNAEVPIRVVESGSMCVPYGGACDG
jgi:signal peptidase I